MQQNYVGLNNEASNAVLENVEISDKKEFKNRSQADNLNDNNPNLNTQASSSMNTQNANQNILPMNQFQGQMNNNQVFINRPQVGQIPRNNFIYSPNQFQQGNFQYNAPASQGYVQYTNQTFPGHFVVMQGNAPNSFPNNQQMSALSQNIPVQRSDRRNKCIIILDTITRILTIMLLIVASVFSSFYISDYNNLKNQYYPDYYREYTYYWQACVFLSGCIPLIIIQFARILLNLMDANKFKISNILLVIAEYLLFSYVIIATFIIFMTSYQYEYPYYTVTYRATILGIIGMVIILLRILLSCLNEYHTRKG